MASTFSDLGIELMATGENAGTWGTKTNTNLQIVEKAIAGYVEKSIAGGAQTTTLSITDGDATESTSVARHAVIKLTGTITGNQVVTVPDSVEKVYIVVNGTSGAFTVQFKTASGTGVTFGTSDKSTKLVFSDGTNIVDASFGGATDLDGGTLTLDADADTTITADTDDQIDIAIAGADDFQFTANTFTALSGSTVATNTIAETTSGSGVTIDGTLVKDGAITNTSLVVGRDSDNDIDFATDNNILFRASGADQIKLIDGALAPVTDDDVDLGTSSLEFKDAFFDGTVTTDALAADSATLAGTLEIDVASGDPTIILDTQGADKFHFAVDDSDSDNLVIKSGGTVGSGNGLKLDSSGNLIVDGDLTVSGDDITMGTNTSGNLLIADGTNFNSIAVGSLSEISTVANDDVFLAVDTSGGGLKKIARSAIVAGLATSGAISNIVEDTSPQLGGDLDTNSANILIDDAHFIADENGNEQIIFQTTSSAVNQFDITNAATGNAPEISATGGDTNIDLKLTPKGSGQVIIDGNVGIDTGVIDLKNGGSQSVVRFYCESSNAHYAQIQAPAHSDFSGNVTLTLPASTDTLTGIAATQTLTNKTLTTPVIAEIDSGSTITLDATTDIILDADGANIIFKDGGVSIATFTNSSTDFIIESATSDKDIIFKVNDGGSSTEVARFDGDVSALLMASGKKIMLGAAEETISGDGTDITFEVGSSGDINIPANIGLTFGDDGEKIEGDGTDLTISGNNINLTATADVVIPNNVGIQFGGASEKIEGDGTDLTISANNLTIDAAADIVLDAAGNDFNFKAGGTEVLRITNSSSDVIIRPVVDAKDLIFQQRDGTEVARIEDNGTFNIVTDKLAINGTAVTSTAAELNLLDGVTSTTTELNIIDGGTSATSTTVADADRVVLNDNGTMVQVAMTDIKTYIGGGTSWQAVKTGDFTASAGQGVFCNTTSAAFTLTLPSSPSIGDEVSFVDYAGTFDTNNLTIARNGSKIHGATENLTIATERAANTLVFTDSTQGWLLKSK